MYGSHTRPRHSPVSFIYLFVPSYFIYFLIEYLRSFVYICNNNNNNVRYIYIHVYNDIVYISSCNNVTVCPGTYYITWRVIYIYILYINIIWT